MFHMHVQDFALEASGSSSRSTQLLKLAEFINKSLTCDHIFFVIFMLVCAFNDHMSWLCDGRYFSNLLTSLDVKRFDESKWF